MWRLFVLLAFAAILGASAFLLVSAGWVPWTIPAFCCILALALCGIAVRRKGGRRLPSGESGSMDLEANPPRHRARIHVADPRAR